MSERSELSYIVPKEHAFRERLKTLRGAMAANDEINKQRLITQIGAGVEKKYFTGDPRKDGILEAEQKFIEENR